MFHFIADNTDTMREGLEPLWKRYTSLLGCCYGVRRVLPCQCSLAGTPSWCVVSGLTVVCAWDPEPVSLFGRPPEHLN